MPFYKLQNNPLILLLKLINVVLQRVRCEMHRVVKLELPLVYSVTNFHSINYSHLTSSTTIMERIEEPPAS